jgi:hypothetical protein
MCLPQPGQKIICKLFTLFMIYFCLESLEALYGLGLWSLLGFWCLEVRLV